jgi:hypothetical protein
LESWSESFQYSCSSSSSSSSSSASECKGLVSSVSQAWGWLSLSTLVIEDDDG